MFLDFDKSFNVIVMGFMFLEAATRGFLLKKMLQGYSRPTTLLKRDSGVFL